MTNKQFVKKHFPDAVLDYCVYPMNTMAPRTYYKILVNNRTERLATGMTWEIAWRNAKKRLNQ